jgi:hypothetical protein
VSKNAHSWSQLWTLAFFPTLGISSSLSSMRVYWPSCLPVILLYKHRGAKGGDGSGNGQNNDQFHNARVVDQGTAWCGEPQDNAKNSKGHGQK